MGLIKREYTEKETIITAENMNGIQDAILALEDGLFTVDNDRGGEVITITDATKRGFRNFSIYGKTTQGGTPTPDTPVDLVSVGSGGSITVNVTGENNAQSMTIATPNGLPGIPVTSGGNYTDANGQQWICDEIDLARGVYVQRTKRVTVNGSKPEYWKISTVQYVTGATRFDISITTEPRALRRMCLCNAYVGTDVANSRAETCWCNAVETTSYLELRICTADTTTVEEMKEMVQSNPVEFLYTLATPIETPLSAEELAAYAALHSYKDSTMVSNDAGAWMELEYVMDAKKYIDSKISAGILEATVE